MSMVARLYSSTTRGRRFDVLPYFVIDRDQPTGAVSLSLKERRICIWKPMGSSNPRASPRATLIHLVIISLADRMRIVCGAIISCSCSLFKVCTIHNDEIKERSIRIFEFRFLCACPLGSRDLSRISMCVPRRRGGLCVNVGTNAEFPALRV